MTRALAIVGTSWKRPPMAWLAGIVVLLLLVFSSGFRKVAGGLVAIAALVVGGFLLDQHQSRIDARTRISASDVDLRDLRLQTGDFGDYKLFGRIRNNSARTHETPGFQRLLDEALTLRHPESQRRWRP
jgi:hypothetical protein